MSVYRTKDRSGKASETYRYDFQLNGRRFAGSTGATSEREALRVEKAVRAKAEAETKLIKQAKGALWTWDKAASAYYEEVLHNRFDATSKSWALWLEDQIGLTTAILDIDTAFIQRLITHKANTTVGRRGQPVTNATLNRTVQEPIQRILRHANRVHRQPLADINWKVLRRKEPSERISELRGDDEAKLMAAVREDYRPLVRFCMTSGLRLHEAVGLRWRDVDFGARQIKVLGKGKKEATVPLPPAIAEILEPLKGHHPEFVFTYVSWRSTTHHGALGLTREKGARYPMTTRGVKKMFMRFRDQAGLPHFRFHDLRHTALSRVVRATKDLQAAQRIARHANVKMTLRYAHILDEDVMAAMEAGARLSTTLPSPTATYSPTKSPTSRDDGRKS